ncbi:hypothetical protein [Achromobacter sp. DMS1]|uniref:hypothetical protein n=1 Tax=Achromobacter sp. DMS1 TaxID=1688405 RepID=UPI000A40F88E|nr:hypothetical protein [Achromobacter sp. DMS1]
MGRSSGRPGGGDEVARKFGQLLVLAGLGRMRFLQPLFSPRQPRFERLDLLALR